MTKTSLGARGAVAVALLLLVACSRQATAPGLLPAAVSPAGARPVGHSLLREHLAIGFSVDTPARAAIAAREGIQSTILYDGPPARGTALAHALRVHGISIVDASVSGILFYWECHRTHTVVPPPKNYGRNPYCATDEDPSIDSPAVVLADVEKIAHRDAGRNDVVAYWTLDDWAWWDYGSAHALLQKVHAVLARVTPGRPAICGFGAGLAAPGNVSWGPGTAANFSPHSCDWVGWYVYSPFGLTHPSNGKGLDWSMRALLPAMRRSLHKYGWQIATTPLLGIGQAWSGRYGKVDYQPGLSAGQMERQAAAFCAFGAASISWYAWDDSGFVHATQTPNNSPVVAKGIGDGLRACTRTWS